LGFPFVSFLRIRCLNFIKIWTFVLFTIMTHYYTMILVVLTTFLFTIYSSLFVALCACFQYIIFCLLRHAHLYFTKNLQSSKSFHYIKFKFYYLWPHLADIDFWICCLTLLFFWKFFLNFLLIDMYFVGSLFLNIFCLNFFFLIFFLIFSLHYYISLSSTRKHITVYFDIYKV